MKVQFYNKDDTVEFTVDFPSSLNHRELVQRAKDYAMDMDWEKFVFRGPCGEFLGLWVV